jgi:hypothetical protein
MDHKRKAKWLLSLDEARFHVYITILTSKYKGIRIDWRDDSVLTFEETTLDEDNEYIVVGRADYCKACIEKSIKPLLKQYRLGDFNCRTVSWLLLLMAGFEETYVHHLFESHKIMCGVNAKESINMDEMRHFIDWSEQVYGCTIF